MAAADVVTGEDVVVGEEVVPPPPAAVVEEDCCANLNRPGWSVGVGATYAVEGFQGNLGRADFGNSWGFNVRGAYRFNEYFAVEGIYEYLNSFEAEGSIDDIAVDAEIWTNTFTVGPKLILPLCWFQPYLAGGIGFVNANADVDIDGRRSGIELTDSNTAFAGRFGGGIDFVVTEHFALYADAGYTMATGDLDELYYFSTGFGAKFLF
jgi:opacity protein-like surface antigen